MVEPRDPFERDAPLSPAPSPGDRVVGGRYGRAADIPPYDPSSYERDMAEAGLLRAEQSGPAEEHDDGGWGEEGHEPEPVGGPPGLAPGDEGATAPTKRTRQPVIGPDGEEIDPMELWIEGARPRTLPAAIVPVLVGTACAVGEVAGGIIWWRAMAALVVALALQVGVNYANDYSDGIRGTDSGTKRAGPRRLVGSGLVEPEAVKKAAFKAFGVAAAFGLLLAVFAGWQLILVGVASIAAAWFYTGGTRPYGYAGLGEVFVFLFFGVVATVGSAFVQDERILEVSIVASFGVGCMASALLVINNLRDIPGDVAVGKNTLAVHLGDRRTRVLYVVLVSMAFAFAAIIAAMTDRHGAALALLALPWVYRPFVALSEWARGPDLIPVLGQTAQLQLIYGLLLTLGLTFGA